MEEWGVKHIVDRSFASRSHWHYLLWHYLLWHYLLWQVAQKLGGLEEFAVDVEQHAYRSYRGFIALVQVRVSEP